MACVHLFMRVFVCLRGWEVRAITKTDYWAPFEANELESLSEQEISIFLNLSSVDLQYCISFKCTTK